MTAAAVPSLIALAFSGPAAQPGNCSYAVDCNARVCIDCTCAGGTCKCADGFSGAHCELTFCNTTSGCSGHGTCEQTARNMTCSCDSGWTGPHCETAACNVTCAHGGTCAASGTSCVGCQGAWSGPTCSSWNSSYPAQMLAARLATFKNRSLAKLTADAAAYNPICRPGEECAGWGIDISTGKVASSPLLFMDFSKGTPSWQGRKYPVGVDVTPSESPGWGEPDARGFKTFTDYEAYVVGLWAEQESKTGFYARDLAKVRDEVFNQKTHDVSPYVTQLPYETVTMEVTEALTLDPNALSVLQGLGPWSDDADNWRAFFRFWGSSVATTSRLGGQVQTTAFASTALNVDHSTSWMREQALCAFQLKTGVGGACAGHDAAFTKYAAAGLFDMQCRGGVATLCGAFHNATSWQASVASAPVLIDFVAKPLSPYISSAGDAALAAIFDDAEAAYIQEQVAKRPAAPDPPTCNGHDPDPNPKLACKCEACYSGRECSVFDYEHPTVQKKLYGTTAPPLGPCPPGWVWGKCTKTLVDTIQYSSCNQSEVDSTLVVCSQPPLTGSSTVTGHCSIANGGKVRACVEVDPPERDWFSCKTGSLSSDKKSCCSTGTATLASVTAQFFYENRGTYVYPLSCSLE